uniref:Uncharacterized protein n=1 Tax=Meloidogyne enterolobii TaxID=390850 RepID=A0A6V7Y7L8_MELEN|nr:unnamed protein product [Meloidogyne enterolobii]
MTFGYVRRSRSVDFYNGTQEKYLSRWSRENTPMDCVDRYCHNVRRSFTPVRDIAGYETIRNDRRSRSVDSYRSPLAIVTAPYHTNINYYQENQPVNFFKYLKLI